MNQKQEIIKFLKDSNKLIYKIIKEEYYNEEDFKEIESWTDQTIQNIYEFWLNYIMKGEGYVGIFFSPWCIQQIILSGEGCKKCGFAGRHNQCMSENSDWTKISKKLNKLDPWAKIALKIKFRLFKTLIPTVSKKEIKDIENKYNSPEKYNEDDFITINYKESE